MALPRRKPRLLWVGLVCGLIVVGAVVAFFALRKSGLAMPGSIDGIPKLTTPDAQLLEKTLAGFKFGDTKIGAAVYGGTASQPDILLEIIKGPLVGSLPGNFLTVFANAGTSTATLPGGITVDKTRLVSRIRNGVEYDCEPATLVGRSGAICSFGHDDLIGIVLTLRTSDPGGAVDVAEKADEAFTAAN